MDRFHGDEPFIAAAQRRSESALRAYLADPDQFDQSVDLAHVSARVTQAAAEVFAAKTKLRNGSPIGYDEIAGTIVEFGDEIYAALVFYCANAGRRAEKGLQS